MTYSVRSSFQAHPFHLVSPSPWPFYTSTTLFSLTLSAALSFHSFSHAINILWIALISLVFSMCLWFRDVTNEGTYMGNHTLAVQKGLNMGVGLFIVSEALFFLAIFWAFFHSALSPTVELGAKWPPLGIDSINPFELPLLNTVILLSSGVTVTYSHHSIIQGNRSGALYGLVYTIVLAVIFTVLQFVEYTVSSFTISDGDLFFMFLLWNRIPRFTRNNRNCFHSRGILTSTGLSSNRKPSFRSRICDIVLTFCRCCLTIPLRICILLRLIVIIYTNNNCF